MTLIVSTGAGSVVMPDVVGQPRGHRQRPAHGPGLNVDIVEQEVTDSSDDGRVLDQAPAAGTRLRAGDKVTIFVGVFTEPETTTTDSTTTTTLPTPDDQPPEARMRVAVICGGRSSEHEISLRSGASVAAGLREAGHDVIEVLIERDGRWLAGGEEVELRAAGGLLGADVAFPVLHGPFGEDGTVQGMLETLDVAYAGPERARRRGGDGQAGLQAPARLPRPAAGRVLRGRRARVARAGRGDAAAAVGEAVAARLERRHLARRLARGRARRRGRARARATTRG